MVIIILREIIEWLALAGMFAGIWIVFSPGWALIVVCGLITLLSSIGHLRRSTVDDRHTTETTGRA